MQTESRSESRKQQTVPVLNWMGTFILSGIPVVNLICYVIWIAASKYPSKRNYAIAMLLLSVLVLVLTTVVCFTWGKEIVAFMENWNSIELRRYLIES